MATSSGPQSSPFQTLEKRNRVLVPLSALLLLVGCFWIIPYGDFRELGHVPQFWIGIGIMGLGFIASWGIRSISARWFWGVAIATRFLLLFMYPGDDIWRYLWEGYLQNLGFSPYHFAPNAAELIPFRTDWWELINHADVSAIYPPVTQWGFRVLAAIKPSVFLFKAAFAMADLAICWLLSRRFGCQQTLIYAWNPLVLYSFAGGGHYDSWFVLPLVAAWLLFEPLESQQTEEKLSDSIREQIPTKMSRRRQLFYWAASALAIGISIAVKWISLPVFAFMFWRAIVHRQIRASIATILALGLFYGFLSLFVTALPFCQVDSCPLIPVSSGFVVHGRSAELIPGIVESIWPVSRSENWLFAFPLGLIVSWLLVRSRNVQQFSEWYLGLLLLLSPVIHAWYFTWIVPFAVASRNLGVRLVSLSVFIYFVLQHRIALNGHWLLTHQEKVFLWLPFILGWVWTTWNHNRHRLPRKYGSTTQSQP